MPRRPPGGHKSEDDAGCDGHGAIANASTAASNGHVLQPQNVIDDGAGDRRDAPASDRRAGDAADERQARALEAGAAGRVEPRVAPSAACVAISRCRATVHASCRLATFAHVRQEQELRPRGKEHQGGLAHRGGHQPFLEASSRGRSNTLFVAGYADASVRAQSASGQTIARRPTRTPDLQPAEHGQGLAVGAIGSPRVPVRGRGRSGTQSSRTVGKSNSTGMMPTTATLSPFS